MGHAWPGLGNVALMVGRRFSVSKNIFLVTVNAFLMIERASFMMENTLLENRRRVSHDGKCVFS